MKQKTITGKKAHRQNERGSALVMVMFSLVIMSIIGISLVYSATNEMRGSKNELLANQAFYAAEAGLQEALSVIRGHRCPNDATDCSPSLASNQINFNIAATLSRSNRSNDTVSYARLSRWLTYNAMDSSGVVILNPAESSLQRLAYDVRVTMLANGDLELASTGYAPLGARRTLRLRVTTPSSMFTDLPAVITELGQNPTGDAGNSQAHLLTGVDCNGGQEKPLVGAVGSANAQNLWNNNFSSAKAGTSVTNLPLSGTTGFVADISVASTAMHTTGSVPFNNSADAARQFIASVSGAADTVVASGGSLPSGALGSTASPKVVVVNGDLSLSPSDGDGAGLLIVTGTLTLNGNFSYTGIIMALGTGRIVRHGGGGGTISGGIVAGAYSAGSSTFDGSPFVDTSGGGNSTIQYCSNAVSAALNRLSVVTVKSFSSDSTN